MKLTLGKKLGLGFGAILTLMVFNAATSYMKSSDIRRNDDLTFEVRIPEIKAAKALQRDLNQVQNIRTPGHSRRTRKGQERGCKEGVRRKLGRGG